MTQVQLDEVRAVLGSTGAVLSPSSVAGALRGLGLLVSEGTVRDTVEALRRESAGAGPLEPLLALRGVTDVLVNGPQQVFVDRGAGLEQVDSPFEDESDVRRLAVRLAAVVGRRLDEGCPFVDARMPNGTRVHAVLGVLTDVGTCLSLRVPARTSLTLAAWVANRTLHAQAADLLNRASEHTHQSIRGVADTVLRTGAMPDHIHHHRVRPREHSPDERGVDATGLGRRERRETG